MPKSQLPTRNTHRVTIMQSFYYSMCAVRAAVSTQKSPFEYPHTICLDLPITPRAIICQSHSAWLVILTELQSCKVFNTPCALSEPQSAPKNHRSKIIVLYVCIRLSYLGLSFAKVTAPNSQYSQSYNHAKLLILLVRCQSRCQHPKNHRSNILILYDWIRLSHLGLSYAKVTAPNS